MSPSRPPQDPYGRHDRTVAVAVERREQGRRRVSSTTRWAIAAAAAGATVLGAGYAHAIPGTSSDSSASTSTSSTGTTTDPDTSGGLQAPDQAPAPVMEPPQAQSGAS